VPQNQLCKKTYKCEYKLPAKTEQRNNCRQVLSTLKTWVPFNDNESSTNTGA